MIKNVNNPEYWDKRYNDKDDTWSLNNPNPVLIQIVEEKRIVPPAKILVAGSGKGDDAFFLTEKGFDTVGIDFSGEAVEFSIKKGGILGSAAKFIQMDLFNLRSEMEGEFDIIYEYVTYCAIERGRIEELTWNFTTALKPGGLLITIPFPIDNWVGGPPFAIDLNLFHESISKYLKLEYYSKEINSIKPRKGREALMIFRKEQ